MIKYLKTFSVDKLLKLLTAVLLVRLIVAVVDLVTPPVGGDAVGLVELVVSTGELARLTVRRGWNEYQSDQLVIKCDKVRICRQWQPIT